MAAPSNFVHTAQLNVASVMDTPLIDSTDAVTQNEASIPNAKKEEMNEVLQQLMNITDQSLDEAQAR